MDIEYIPLDGSQFDQLVEHDQTLQAGTLAIKVFVGHDYPTEDNSRAI